MAARDSVLDESIARNDLDELIREVDRRTDGHDWDGLARLAIRARAAFDRGFQLWPAAALAEVAASTHPWIDLAPHLVPGPMAGLVAHERVVRGDDLRDQPVPFADVFDVPLALEPWEPAWPVATYTDHEVVDERPPLPAPTAITVPVPGATAPDADAEAALRHVAEHWHIQSNGTVDVVSVSGSAYHAIAALQPTARRAVEIDGHTALAHMAWAAASSGAHGRRRGAAAGRDAAWGCLRALDALDRVDELGWFVWDDGHVPAGWHLFLAIEDARRNRAWALRAHDTR